MTSEYEIAIFNYFNQDGDDLPINLNVNLKKSTDLRYGENPHQRAAFYVESNKTSGWLQHQGKKLSYNNYIAIIYE